MLAESALPVSVTVQFDELLSVTVPIVFVIVVVAFTVRLIATTNTGVAVPVRVEPLFVVNAPLFVQVPFQVIVPLTVSVPV